MFEEVEKRIKEGLLKGNVIYDATNINYKKRRAFLQRLNKMEVEKIAVLVATPYEECLERNAKRDRTVPEDVIKRMYYNFYIPQYYEGFNNITIKYNTNKTFNFVEFMDKLDISQDNPHHSLTIKEHCYECRNNMYDSTSNINLICAGYLHDIGKLEAKTFVNARGEKTDIAHYYNHEKIGAYISLFFLQRLEKEEILYITNLIQWHMLLHFNLLDKTKTKYRNMLGEDIWRDLEILHKADCEAR